jgi:hypothetical protein
MQHSCISVAVMLPALMPRCMLYASGGMLLTSRLLALHFATVACGRKRMSEEWRRGAAMLRTMLANW